VFYAQLILFYLTYDLRVQLE